MLKIANTKFSSRLFIGTGKFSSSKIMQESILASKSEMVTVSIKRIDISKKEIDSVLKILSKMKVKILPNTSGAKNAKEAIFSAHLAREALNTNWIKLEIHPEKKYLLPDSLETLIAAEVLVKEGFIVLPYCFADPVVCKKLVEVGCSAVMPVGSPIGSNQGIKTEFFLKIISEQITEVPIIVDSGIGSPEHIIQAMKIGIDGFLVNTAIATSLDPVCTAKSFYYAIQCGEYFLKKEIKKSTDIFKLVKEKYKF
ncbi:thiazole synthase [bacterium endosymbiont of Pedicinus badii]|uniref:thiazole synthase n=1 Tax=bacterium endosymbiont of Pedicinus badii TaxID=1719126 RepID=UPI0009BC50F6|nr:thiazole synthase [bacterium endosymbiont of Pedicinus badii]OQM34038.1 thiazole synthase [bacterium endosymbiont of Pedicinus badii]